MQPSIRDIRTAVTAENLFVKAFKGGTYKITDNYILHNNKVDRINIQAGFLDSKIKKIEDICSQVDSCCFLVDPSTAPKDLKHHLILSNYVKDVNYDDVWWFKKLNESNPQLLIAGVTIREVETAEDLLAKLTDTELKWWINVFGNCLFTKSELCVTKLHVGEIGDTAVAVYASAFYKNISIYKGAEVTINYRRKGVNTQMMQHWINEAREFGCTWAVFQTDSDNIASINSGKKFGFKKLFVKECFCKKLL